MAKLFRISTVPISLNILLKGQLRFLNQHFEVTAISGSGSDLDEVKEREGVKVHPIDMQRQISPLKDLVALIRLYLYFKKEKPDIIHSITPKAGLLSMIAGKLAGVPVRMHTFTGLVFPYKKGMMQKVLIIMDKLLCYCATNVYPEGQGVKNDLERYGITKKPLKIIANGNINGIDLDYFDPQKVTQLERQELRNQLNIKEKDVVFLFVGRLVRDKGINELVAAFKMLQNLKTTIQLPNASAVKLLLVGPYEEDLDPILPETKKIIENNANIIAVGFRKEVRPYFAIADTFVFPSHREGFPNVLLQSGAMGLFSIVTNISGSNEIIKNGINGQIIAVNHKEELCSALDVQLNKNEEKLSTENLCRSMISEAYNQGFVWDNIKNEYFYLIGNN